MSPLAHIANAEEVRDCYHPHQTYRRNRVNEERGTMPPSGRKYVIVKEKGTGKPLLKQRAARGISEHKRRRFRLSYGIRLRAGQF